MMAHARGASDQRLWLRQLFNWEREFHKQGEDVEKEVIKCLRLHIGDCKLLNHVIGAFDPPQGLAFEELGARVQNTLQPVRDACRSCYRADEIKTDDQTSNTAHFKCLRRVYHYVKVALHAVKPFLSVSLLYAEYLKNVWFGWVFLF